MIAHVADGAVIAARQQDGDAAVPELDERFDRLIGRLMVIHRDGGKVLLAESSEAIGVGAADVGHTDERKLRRGVIITPAKEEQGAQLLLTL